MGGLNLEVFKVRFNQIPGPIDPVLQNYFGDLLTDMAPPPQQFGMYVMFPIGVMYYFGTNLDNRFAVPEFWPKAEHSHKIPFDRDEIKSEYIRLAKRQRAFDEIKREREAAQAAQNPAPSNAEQS
ncbi:hypothetical protein CNYM01_04611 [Colletotrichum nymphaeae SA-01]|uniref:Mitochondrial cytochrome c oxidase assembly factor n=1 Tax=Colletotrichum nymphaeae SA-01 TaxID=1460502 RepID=A0A135SZA7_9PEZI|nr:hypothetical protein CNYM01_04611 [Colletotrichum nymphaeae SA-01]